MASPWNSSAVGRLRAIKGFKDYSVAQGKPKLEGLPATYTESPKEAMTLTVYLKGFFLR